MIRLDAILSPTTFFPHFPQILFLDVLFPLSVKKIIYVDADQGTFGTALIESKLSRRCVYFCV